LYECLPCPAWWLEENRLGNSATAAACKAHCSAWLLAANLHSAAHGSGGSGQPRASKYGLGCGPNADANARNCCCGPGNGQQGAIISGKLNTKSVREMTKKESMIFWNCYDDGYGDCYRHNWFNLVELSLVF
jgi:hypothetical protein